LTLGDAPGILHTNQSVRYEEHHLGEHNGILLANSQAAEDARIDSAVASSVAALQTGGFAVVVDDEDRENEGDLIMAAEAATPESVAFMIRHTSGLLCVPLPGERLDQLRLPLMAADNTESQRTAFTVSVDLAAGITTGISASDRAATIRALAASETRPEDLARPGHVFPLRYSEGGVLKRAGHTEAAIDLCRLAGLTPAGVLSEITNDDGSMARLPELGVFAAHCGLPVLSIADLVCYRRKREVLVTRVGQGRIPTEYGEFLSIAYASHVDGVEHVALVMGKPRADVPTLVRVHSECVTGDVFGSVRCDCGEQLRTAMCAIGKEGCGVIVYLRGHEGRGIGLAHKLRAYELQDSGRDTVEANLELGLPVDSREYGIGAQMLADLGVRKLRLMTNNPAKYGGLGGFGLDIVERVPLQTRPTPDNIRYLQTKQSKLGHALLEADLGAFAPAAAGEVS
jgi:3,4-dihydroxy 2-butanone 4-phosphate synthase/GTP cyclohydrolase II